MTPPMVYEVTKPSSQRTNKITTNVQSIFTPPYAAILRRSDSFCEKEPTAG
jgi:hypothetical protein